MLHILSGNRSLDVAAAQLVGGELIETAPHSPASATTTVYTQLNAKA